MAIKCCNGCVPPKRYPGCKANCPDYIIDNAFHQAEMEEERKKKEISFGITAQRSASVRKATKKSRNKYGLARRTKDGK